MSQLQFRKAALDHLASAARLDQLIQITSPWSWLIMATLYLILITIVVWAFIGKIPTWVQGQGLLLTENGSVYNAVAPEGEGRVVQIAVLPGDQVKEGQVVAYLQSPDLAGQAAVAQDYLNQLKTSQADLKKTADQEITTRSQFVDQQNAALNKIIELQSANLTQAQQLVSMRQTAFNRGLDTKERLIDALQMYNNAVQEIHRSKDAVTQNQINKTDFISQWNERLRSLDMQIQDQQYKVNDLNAKLHLAKEVHSPITGMVTTIQTAIGNAVRGGDPIVSVVTLGKGMDAVIYVNAEEGKLVQPDMDVLVSPGNVKKEEYGSLKGKVISVSNFPATPESMVALLQNQDLVKKFTQAGPAIAVRIRLFEDPHTFSGYAWSSSQGPPQKVTPGTSVAVRITVRQQHPVNLVIPAFKQLIGI